MRVDNVWPEGANHPTNRSEHSHVKTALFVQIVNAQVLGSCEGFEPGFLPAIQAKRCDLEASRGKLRH
jgi:hypothetical protein